MQDSTYQDRYTKRTRDKIAAILESFDPTGKRCLDIGCNQGELSRELLRADGTGTVTVGLDLVDVVPKEIKSHPRFISWIADVAAVELPQHDVTFCLSVLHHVLGHHGWDTYEATLRRVLLSAPVVFIEVGVPSEEGSFYWKDRILERFRTDESWQDDFCCHVLASKCDVIASLPIHGSFRHVYRIETVTPKGCKK